LLKNLRPQDLACFLHQGDLGHPFLEAARTDGGRQNPRGIVHRRAVTNSLDGFNPDAARPTNDFLECVFELAGFLLAAITE